MPRIITIITLYISLTLKGFSASPEGQLAKILQADNTAITEITGWIYQNLDRIRTNEAQRNALALRIHDRLNKVRQQYLDFLKQHPKHTKARIAYGSFLTHIDNRQGAIDQWKLALTKEPNNAAALNNLATHLGTIALQAAIGSGVEEALKAMEKAVILEPKQPLYHHNYATLLCSFTKDASNYYKISFNRVILKALKQYDIAMELDPDNFEYAADRAEAFLDMSPFIYKDALKAWNTALKISSTQDERDWVNLQITIAHYKARRWSRAATTLKKMSGEHHQPLMDQIQKAVTTKIKTGKSKP